MKRVLPWTPVQVPFAKVLDCDLDRPTTLGFLIYLYWPARPEFPQAVFLVLQVVGTHVKLYQRPGQ